MEEELKQFAQKIKAKYPDYADLDDIDLAEKVIRKHPVYASQVKLPPDFRLLQTSSGYSKIDDLYEQIGREENVDPNLLLEQGRKETAFKPENFYGTNKSPKGAVGAGQFMSGTAPTYGLTVNANQDDRTDPIKSVRAQAKYMRKLLDQFNNDESLALAGYNSGEYRKSLQNGQIPNIAETQDYVKEISENLKKARESKSKSLRDYLGNAQPATVTPATPQADQNSQLNAYQQAMSKLPPNSPQPSFEDWSKGNTTPILNPQQAKTPAIIVNPDLPSVSANPTPQTAIAPVSDSPDFSYALQKAQEAIQNHSPAGQNYQEYLKAIGDVDSEQNRQNYNLILKDNQKAAVEQNKVDLAKYKRESQQSNALTPIQTQGTVLQPQQTQQIVPQTRMGVLKDEDFGQSLAGNVAVDLRQKPKGMSLDKFIFTQGLRGVASKYGLTEDDINRAVNTYQAKGDLIQGRPDLANINDNNLAEYLKTHGNPTFQITREMIAAAKGNDELAKADFKQEQQDNALRLASQQDPLSFKSSDQASLDKSFRTSDYQQELSKQRDLASRGLDPDLYAQAEEYVRTDPASEQTQEAVNARYKQLVKEKLSPETTSTLEAIGSGFKNANYPMFGATGLENDIASGAIGTFGQTIGDYGAGALRYAKYLSPLIAVQDYLFGGSDEAYTALRKLGNGARVFQASAKSPGGKGDFGQFIGAAAVDVPKYMALSALPGGAIVGFGLDSALRSAGQGNAPLDIGKDVAKGLLMGAIFHSAVKVESSLEKGFQKALVGSGKAAPDVVLASKVFGTLGRIGYVGIGSGTVEKLSGASTPDAFKAGIIMALTDLAFQGQKFGEIKDLAGRVFRMYDGKTGETANVSIDPDGSVKLLKNVPESTPTVEVDVSKTDVGKVEADGNYRVGKGVEIVEPPKEYQKFVNKQPIDAEVEPIETKPDETKISKPSTPENAPDAIQTNENASPEKPQKTVTYGRIENGKIVDTQEIPEDVMKDFLAQEWDKEYGKNTVEGSVEKNITDRAEKLEAKPQLQPQTEKPTRPFKEPETVKEVLPETESAPLAKSNLSRNFRAGTNDATLTFESELQKNLYDYYANEKKAMSGGGQKANESRVKDLSSLRDSLAKQLNIEPNKVFGVARDVSLDVRSQMKDVKHLEERRVVDNINNKIAPLPITETAGIRRDLAKGLAPEKIAEKRGVKLEQIKNLPPIPEKGQFGKVTSLLMNSDFAGNPELHKALGLDIAEPTKSDSMSAVMDKISQDLNVPRSSHISPSLWSKWLDNNAHKLPENAVAKVESALLEHSDWSKRRDEFANDEKLHKFLGDVGGEIDKGVIKDFSSLKPISKRAIIAKAKQYGLSEQTAKDTFNAAVSRYLERRTDESRSGEKGEVENQEIESSEQTKPGSEKIGGIQLSIPATAREHQIAGRLNNLRDNLLSAEKLARLAKSEIKDDHLLINEFATEIIRQAFSGMRNVNFKVFLGAFLNGKQADELIKYIEDLGQSDQRLANLADNLRIASNNDYGDLILVTNTPKIPEGLKPIVEEERAHRADTRVNPDEEGELLDTSEPYGESAEFIKGEGYEDFSKAGLTREVTAKLFRSDAAEKTGLSEQKISEAKSDYGDYLLAISDLSVENIASEFEIVSEAGKEFANELRTRDVEKRNGEIESGQDGEPGLSPTFSRTKEIRQGGRSDSRPTRQREGVRGGLKDTDQGLFGISGAKNTALERRDFHNSQLVNDILLSTPAEPKTGLAKKLFNQLVEKRNDTFTPKKEVLVNFRRAGLLTSPKTHLRNIISNAAFQGTEEAMRPVALLADLAASAVSGRRTVQNISVPGVLKSFRALVAKDKTLQGLNQETGLAKAWSILKNGDTEELSKNQLQEMRSGSPLLDKFVNYTFRALGAEDAIFKVYSLRRSLEEQAKTLAITKSRDMTFNSYNTRRTWINAQKQHLLENPTREMLLEGMLYADFATFTNNNVISDLFKLLKDPAAGSKNQSLANASKVWKSIVETVVPYDKTPTNIILRTLEYSPVGFGFAAKHLIDWKRGKSYTIDQLRKGFDERWEVLDKNRNATRSLLDTKIVQLLEDGGRLEKEVEKLSSKENRSIEESRRLLKLQKELDERKAKISVYGRVRQRRGAKDMFREQNRKEFEQAIDDLFPRIQQQQFAKSFGRAGLGSAALALGILLAALGKLSGVWDAGEEDEKKEFYKRKDKGILNGSLVIGNRRYQINDTPIGKTMALGASIYERSRKGKGGTSKTFEAVGDVSKNLIMEQPLLNSLNDYFGSDKPIDKRIGGLLGSFVPAILNDIADVADDENRKTESILDFPANRVPMLRESLPKHKYPREKYLQNRGNRLLNKFDPLNSRPAK